MERKSYQLWRGLLTIFLSLAIVLMSLTGVMNEWRSAIDQALGTSSTETTGDSKFVSKFESTDELVEAHRDLGERVAEEGAVLLKNLDNTLPLDSAVKVTLFGMGSVYPYLGGVMGSSVSSADQVDLVTALSERGFEVNPTVTKIYQSFGEIVTGEVETWGGTRPVYGYRPAGFSTPYEPSEPSIDSYTMTAEEGGAGADVDFADSFAEYNDAAIIVFSRPGSEGSDYYPGEAGIDQEKYGTESSLCLTNNERALLEIAKENFDNIIVMINSGSAMEIDELKADDGIDSILYIGFPGAYGFLGIADILKGDANPSGHLADTYVVDNSSAPAAENFGYITLEDSSAISYADSLMPGLAAEAGSGSFGGSGSLAASSYLVQAEGIYVGYKYYETRYYDSVVGAGNASSAVGASNGAASWDYDNEVSFSFGYGLSYTTFEQTLKSVDVDINEKTITATVAVKNTGDVSGKSVAQLYVQTPYTDYDKMHNVEKSAIEFLGMEKTDELMPGETQELSIVVDMKYMASWDSTAKDGKGGYILDGGDYFFAIGNGAHEAVNNMLGEQGDGNGNSEMVSVETIGKDGTVDEKSFAYSENGTEIVNQLEDADINYYLPGYATYLSRSDWEGTYPRTYDDLVIGGDKADEWVMNLANEVYQIATDGDVNPEGSGGTLKLADLAGVDIDDARWDQLVEQIPVDTLIAKITKGGNVSDVIEEINSPLVYQNDGPNGFGGSLNSRGLLEGDPNADFSTNTMANEVLLGCTFNKELILEWGELLGNDGLWSGNYSIWGSAPNTHRTAFNGRNFEYYSEDPMLSNYLSAATVEGALNYGVIIGPKHIAFNDQETARSGVAPYMTEQKAREGDLRAFQGSFEDAGALGAMTSFTRIGATAVNGSWGILRAIMRDEWGFNGILSTDMMNNSGYFRPEMCIYAGITMIADFGTDETMEQVLEQWPYFTVDVITKDEELVSYARENMKYQLYAFSQSAAQNIETISVTPWWEKAFNAAIYISFALAALSLVLYLLSIFKKTKEEE